MTCLGCVNIANACDVCKPNLQRALDARADKYQPGDVVQDAKPRQTDAELLAEVSEFAEDLDALIYDLRQRRGQAASGTPEKAKLRAVGSALEDAIREIRRAERIAKGLPAEHDGRGPG